MFKKLMFSMLGIHCLFGHGICEEPDGAKQKVTELLQNFNKAVNQDQTDLLITFWTDNAELTNPTTGELVEGKNEINEFLQKRAKEIKDRQLQFSFTPLKTDFPDENSAVIEGVVEITDKGALLQRNARRVELVNENGNWLIDTVSDIEVAPAPNLYAHLKDLEWLIGNWKDEDNNVSITFNTGWDKFKNFIHQKFKMDVYNLSVMEGTQIIGWAPLDKSIRSWVFDSDGGTGTGLWTKDGDSWKVAMNYTLSDGNKGSATNVYTKINDKSYKYSSVARKLNGEDLPDIEPVTVEKED